MRRSKVYVCLNDARSAAGAPGLLSEELDGPTPTAWQSSSSFRSRRANRGGGRASKGLTRVLRLPPPPRGEAVVSKVQCSVYRVPTDQPEADGTLEWSATTLVLAEVTAGPSTGTGWTYASAGCKPLMESELPTQSSVPIRWMCRG